MTSLGQCQPCTGHRKARPDYFTAGIALAFLFITIGCLQGMLA